MRSRQLASSNLQLTQEIEERRRAEDSLQGAFSEMRRLKDRLQAENIYLQQEVAQEYNFGEIIGNSVALSQVLQRVEWVAPMNASVLLLGETGTGKGVAARAIHNSSARVNRPLITVNLTALPANLIESELFGWERGEFTGADARQIGRLELADGGTIFLEEIGELPLELQGKLLRLIRDGALERLGSPLSIKVDVRIIASSSRDLEHEVRCGRFQEELFYRLKVFPITMPPLRQRKEDIPLLVGHFVAKYNRKVGKKIETVSNETMNDLKAYRWPGNVRELESVIERAVILSQGLELEMPERFDTPGRSREELPEGADGVVELEQAEILRVLEETGWRLEGKNGAAGVLGLNPSTLRARMRKYGILRHVA
ncbi:MAG: hypothetical protein A2075_04635 [Geobacteraceae bacterium GWC2_58_44]|nr:MAG: hypothetical protein A2075_04635 [Geobacteraceae bacterium GWC2_58_44]